MPRILFICTGNICRSPAAEGLLRQRLEQEGLSGWEVESAGTWGLDAHPASAHMLDLMGERDVDLTRHRSREVDRRIMEEADLVLVMTEHHAEALYVEFLDQANKVFLLSEMRDGRRRDVEDPYGGSLEEYRACVEELEELIEGGMDRIQSLATSPR